MLICKSKDTKKYVKPMSQALSLQKVRTKDLTRKQQKLKKKEKKLHANRLITILHSKEDYSNNMKTKGIWK